MCSCIFIYFFPPVSYRHYLCCRKSLNLVHLRSQTKLIQFNLAPIVHATRVLSLSDFPSSRKSLYSRKVIWTDSHHPALTPSPPSRNCQNRQRRRIISASMRGIHDKRLTPVITLLIIHGKNCPGQSPQLDLMDRVGEGGGKQRGVGRRGVEESLSNMFRPWGRPFLASRDNHKNTCKLAHHRHGVCVFICNSSYNTFTLSCKLANNSPRGKALVMKLTFSSLAPVY